jgi:RNA polymerase sigma-70 factor (TIGR02960 family)
MSFGSPRCHYLRCEWKEKPVEDALGMEKTLTRARMGDGEAFRALTEPYRRELQLHCYRILGSNQDAEDLVQETLLAAWRGIDQFEGRSSLRSWLYRIATNRCLNALRDAGRRPQLEWRNEPVEPTRFAEPIWLEPYPDALLEGVADASAGPDVRYETRESVALAFVAALQHLPPRQRAVLVLRDVLGFRAAEAADILETSEASVNSALQRARETVEAQLPSATGERAPGPGSTAEREVVQGLVDAFERADVDRLIALLTDDALLTMPPEPFEYVGPALIAKFFLQRGWWTTQRIRLVPTRANGQPAFGYYLQDPRAAIAHANGLVVVTLDGDKVSALTRFGDTGMLPHFGLPRTLRS